MKSLISYIPQDAPLFHRTLRENILYEAPESVSDEDVSKVIARTGIQEMQKRFEQKEKAWNLETTVSGGERQRINLARALIYVLDEGSVQENGSHEELMKKKGRYYRLFEEQVKKNDEKQITG